MKVATATYDGVSAYRGRGRASGNLGRFARGAGGSAAMGLGAIATVGLLGAAATLAAVGLIAAKLAPNPHSAHNVFAGPGTLRLASADPVMAIAADTSFESKWTVASTGGRLIIEVPEDSVRQVIAARPAAVQVAKLEPIAAPDVVPLPPVRHTVQAEHVPASIPLPRANPAPREVAAVPPPAPPAADKRAPMQEAHNNALPDPDSRTAIYDISARAVFLPNGEKLEAHSGLYDKMDDPRFVHVRMHGATPPNVYDLTLREELFHGVRAIRLTPINEDKMFGRDGILAHTYMLGPNGQSNGCVSFKNYDKFLQAFLRGEVDRIVVVPEGGIKLAAASRRRNGGRYASRGLLDGLSGGTW